MLVWLQSISLFYVPLLHLYAEKIEYNKIEQSNDILFSAEHFTIIMEKYGIKPSYVAIIFQSIHMYCNCD